MNPKERSLDLSSLLDDLGSLPQYHSLLAELDAGQTASRALPLPRSVRPYLAAALARDLNRLVLLLTARNDRLLSFAEEIGAWSPGTQTWIFPEPNPLFYERAPWGPRTIRQRAATLAALNLGHRPGVDEPAGPRQGLILATARAIMSRSLPADEFSASSHRLRAGSTEPFEGLLRSLVGAGYASVSVVTEPGQFSRRGGILDVWPPAEGDPIRIEFFGDEIESMRSFDASTQRSSDPVEALRLTPAREGLPRLFKEGWEGMLPPQALESLETASHEPFLEFFIPWMTPVHCGLLDHLPPGAVILIDDRVSFDETIEDLEAQAIDFRADQVRESALPDDAPLPYLTLTEIRDSLSELRAVDMGLLSQVDQETRDLGAQFEPGPRFAGKLKPLLEHLAAHRVRHESSIVVSRQASRLAELWGRQDGDAQLTQRLPNSILSGDVYFLDGALAEGWSLRKPAGERLHLITDAEIFGWARPRPRRTRRRRIPSPESSYADLQPGFPVVHVDYGVGRFLGLVERTIGDLTREYLLVEYADGGQVYVPVHQADRITRYVGVDGVEPKLSRLGAPDWDRVKERAQRAVEEVARDLLQLYAKRHSVHGHAFSQDTEWQRELEASFAYIETEDQVQAIEAVKADMEAPRPMDRLICGDAGYGKTEVALRAAFKAVMDGTQVAMLVPTTVLAQQHFNTFRERLAAYPVSIEMLSRFRSRSEASKIVSALAQGQVDIVIGTHRLLQEDVAFNDLGLLIIDEEQRFGVTHKEHLKQMRTEVDVLTLTATPIPRTLYMALTGARDISTIQTPPEERLPVITRVGSYDPRLIRQAVLREFDRGGQVFFVHNRIHTIEAMRQRLERLVPEVTIAVAHGQMAEKELSQVMERFTDGAIDVLLCTSIIESGLDIPNANTLIVDQADRFGLAQLYQLRGRVGRGAARAYAYFLRPSRALALEDAHQRLEAIAENTQLGSGYSIALRDLELRGAGDILGTRQHGHIAAIGFHLYTRLLASAVRRLRGQFETAPPQSDLLREAAEPLPVSIELPLPSVIPEGYVSDRALRLQLYRRMSEVRGLEEVASLADELEDRFGPPPAELENLLYQLRIKIMAARAEIDSVRTENGQILLEMPDGQAEDIHVDLGSDVRRSRRGLWLSRRDNPRWPERLEQILQQLGA